MPGTGHRLPGGARDLLLGPIDSFEKLEIILALRGTGGVPETARELAARCGMAADQLEEAAEQLFADGLIDRSGRAWTERASSPAQRAIEELASVWATRRVEVVELVRLRAMGRLRASASRAFVDAIRPRKPGHGDDHG